MDISEILSSLSPEDIEQLKGAASAIFGGQSQKEADNGENSSKGLSFDPSLLGSIGQMGKLMSGDDENTALIKALKPMLSEDRRQKADEALKILRLIKLLPLLKSSGLLNDLL